jgi:preprotein translocase subunit SecG
MYLPIVINVLLVIHVMVSLLIILIVLMQRPKNEGLGAAFGGGMTENLFGAQTTNVLQTITRWLGGMFFVLTLLLSILYVKQGGSRSAVQEKLSTASAPAAPTPAPVTQLPNREKESVFDDKGKVQLETTKSVEPNTESEPAVKLQVPPTVGTPPVPAPALPTPEPLPTVPNTLEKSPNPAPTAPGSESKNQTPPNPTTGDKPKESAPEPTKPVLQENKPSPAPEPPK